MNKENIHSRDLYLPCILNRLTDQDPQNKIESTVNAVTIKDLKRDILRNIEMILNSRSRPEPSELQNDSELIYSVLGFGLSDFCGRSHGPIEKNELKDEIIRQIQHFEPRLDSESLVVKFCEQSSSTSNSVLELEIAGRIAMDPLTEEIAFFSRMNFEDGNTIINLI